MSALEVFRFDATAALRVVLRDGEPWFVLADVCRAVEITNVGNVAARLPDEMKGVHLVDTPGGQQSATVVSEAGMYEVVFRSDKPEAVRFRHWVTGTVLPQIRRTGSFGPAQLDPTTPEGMRLVLEAASAALAALEVAKPKADAWDELASGTGDYSVADAAKMLSRAGIETGQKRLFDKLEDLGWIFRRGGRWQAYQSKVGAGLLAYKAQSHRHPGTDETIVDAPQIRVTVDGVRKLRDLIRAAEPLEALTA